MVHPITLYLNILQNTNQENLENPIETFSQIQANLGGTEILQPLQHIFSTPSREIIEDKLFFLLMEKLIILKM